MEKLEKHRRTMTVDILFFEHLLNCMANQKFLSELLPEEQKANQEIIDDAWGAGMILLSEEEK